LEHPAEEHVLRSRTRCILAPPVVENLGQRAANVYSMDGTTYSAPKFCTSVGDAPIPLWWPFLIGAVFFLKKGLKIGLILVSKSTQLIKFFKKNLCGSDVVI
jgi:hypothetical protein